jgi:non-homologous end joining protein Ku
MIAKAGTLHPMKAIKTTTLSLGLINLPVSVAAATETASDVSFSLHHDGNPVEQVYRDKVTGEIVGTKAACGRAVNTGTAKAPVLVPVAEDDITSITDDTKLADIPVLDIVDVSEAVGQSHRIEGMYYFQMAKGGSPNTMKLFVDVLKDTGKAFVAKWTPRTRQELLVIRAVTDADTGENLLIGHSYAFASDMRKPDEAVRAHLAGKYTQAEFDMAKQLIEAMAGEPKYALDTATDDAIARRQALVDEAMKGTLDIPAKSAAAPQEEKNTALADALAMALAAQKEKVPVNG